MPPTQKMSEGEVYERLKVLLEAKLATVRLLISIMLGVATLVVLPLLAWIGVEVVSVKVEAAKLAARVEDRARAESAEFSTLVSLLSGTSRDIRGDIEKLDVPRRPEKSDTVRRNSGR